MLQTLPMNTYESIHIGDSFSFNRVITAEDVRTFAALTGDDNPIHVNEEYAAKSRFGKRVVHGIFLLGIISKVLGRDFPGHGSIAVGISCRFIRPVPVDSEIKVEIKIFEKIEERKRVRARVYIYHKKRMALAGETTIIPPSPEDEEDPEGGEHPA